MGEEYPHTLTAAHNLGVTLAHEAKYGQAEEILQASLEAERCVQRARQRPSSHACHWH